jgi:hypothetical protein
MKKSSILTFITAFTYSLILNSCSKSTDSTSIAPVTSNPTNPTNPLTPPTPAACPIVNLSSINQKTSHYNPYFVPFTNYFGLANDKAQKYSCVGITGRTYLNINNNNIPDLVLTEDNGCGFTNGKTYVYIDNVLKWTFDNPQILTRKMARGDFNGDGYDDVVLFGTGHDGPPFAGDKVYIIYFKPDSYSIIPLDNLSEYFHTGCVGDINNDGFLDIIPIGAQIKDCNAYLNDGKGNFVKKKLFDGVYTNIVFHSELYDINKDGNIDIILGGHEWTSDPNSQNPNTRILLGDGKGNFDINNPIIIPKVEGWGVITDFDFADLDNDGTEELIITRTSGSLGSDLNGVKKNPNGFYDDFRIQILKKSDNSYLQSQLLQSPQGWENAWIQWIDWTFIKDIDGDCNLDIVPDAEYLNDPTFSDLSQFNKLYYKGDGKGGFSVAYKK